MSNTRVYVGGLLANVRKEDLDREFSRFGRLRDVWVAHNPPGFAFIQFADSRDAEAAVRNLDGQNVCGSRVRVEVSKTRSKQGDGGGRGRSFGRGRGFSSRGRGGSRMSSRGPPRRPFSMSSRDRYDDYGRSSYRDDSRNRDRDRFPRDSAMNGGGWGSRSPPSGGGYRSRSPVGRRRLSPSPPYRRSNFASRDQDRAPPPGRDFPKRLYQSPDNSFNTSYRSRSPPSRPRY